MKDRLNASTGISALGAHVRYRSIHRYGLQASCSALPPGPGVTLVPKPASDLACSRNHIDECWSLRQDFRAFAIYCNLSPPTFCPANSIPTTKACKARKSFPIPEKNYQPTSFKWLHQLRLWPAGLQGLERRTPKESLADQTTRQSPKGCDFVVGASGQRANVKI